VPLPVQDLFTEAFTVPMPGQAASEQEPGIGTAAPAPAVDIPLDDDQLQVRAGRSHARGRSHWPSATPAAARASCNACRTPQAELWFNLDGGFTPAYLNILPLVLAKDGSKRCAHTAVSPPHWARACIRTLVCVCACVRVCVCVCGGGGNGWRC
jgi:hypothetical protein